MKVTAIVPIKLNNERCPGKNTRLLDGKPLISYCLEALLKVDAISDIYVYCSSDEIASYLPEGVTFLRRSQNLDLPTSNFTQIFQEFSKTVDSDIYVYAHATAPFTKPETIKSELDAVLSGQYDSAFCAEKLQDYLWYNGEPLNFDAKNLPRSQDLPIYYRETSGVYVYTREVFQQYKRRIGKKPYIVEVDRKEAVDINTTEDFTYAETMIHST